MNLKKQNVLEQDNCYFENVIIKEKSLKVIIKLRTKYAI